MLDRLLAASPRLRVGVFAVAAAVLTVAVFVFSPSPPPPGSASSRRTTPAPPAVAPAGGVSPSRLPTASPTAGADLPLPVSPADLTFAASLASRVVTAENTYRYTQNDAAWAAAIESMTVGVATTQVTASVPSGTQRAVWVAHRLVATATATPTAIYLIAPDSIVFDVRADQTVSETTGVTSTHTVYQVTTVRSGATWRVSQVQVAGTGNN